MLLLRCWLWTLPHRAMSLVPVGTITPNATCHFGLRDVFGLKESDVCQTFVKVFQKECLPPGTDNRTKICLMPFLLGTENASPLGYFSMAALPGDISLCLDANHRSGWPERRKRLRMQVHWPVRFPGRGGALDGHETVTRDLSSDGFQCFAKVSCAPGESLMCILGVPTNDPQDAGRILQVKCKIRVVWVKQIDGGYSMGCRIENYQFVDTLPGGLESYQLNL